MSNCIKCGIYLPEGLGMICQECEKEKEYKHIWGKLPACVITDKKIEEKEVTVCFYRSNAGEMLMFNSGETVIEFTGGNVKRLLEAISEALR